MGGSPLWWSQGQIPAVSWHLQALNGLTSGSGLPLSRYGFPYIHAFFISALNMHPVCSFICLNMHPVCPFSFVIVYLCSAGQACWAVLSHASPPLFRVPRPFCACAQHSDDVAVSLALFQNGGGTRAALLRMRDEFKMTVFFPPFLRCCAAVFTGNFCSRYLDLSPSWLTFYLFVSALFLWSPLP